MDWQPHDIEINGLNLRYWRGGSGKPMLMLHGVTDNGLVWGRTAETLAQNYDVILLDQRGHGFSDDPKAGGYSITLMASDAAALLKALDMAPATVMGHSMGGAVAMRLGVDYPEVLERLILVDPALIEIMRPQDENARYEWFAWLRDLKALTLEQRIERQKNLTPHWSEAEIYQMSMSKSQVRPSIWEEGGLGMERTWREFLPQISVPTLITRGDPEYGALVTDETAEEARKLLQKGDVVKVEKTGHIVHLDGYEQFIGFVQAFLAQEF